jgi:hypothetical protein
VAPSRPRVSLQGQGARADPRREPERRVFWESREAALTPLKPTTRAMRAPRPTSRDRGAAYGPEDRRGTLGQPGHHDTAIGAHADRTPLRQLDGTNHTGSPSTARCRER